MFRKLISFLNSVLVLLQNLMGKPNPHVVAIVFQTSQGEIIMKAVDLPASNFIELEAVPIKKNGKPGELEPGNDPDISIVDPLIADLSRDGVNRLAFRLTNLDDGGVTAVNVRVRPKGAPTDGSKDVIGVLTVTCEGGIVSDVDFKVLSGPTPIPV